MCTSVNPNTNQLGLMNYQSVVLTFDTVSYRANWYSLTFDFTSTIKYWLLICMGDYHSSPSACHFKCPFRSPIHILSTTKQCMLNFLVIYSCNIVAMHFKNSYNHWSFPETADPSCPMGSSIIYCANHYQMNNILNRFCW